MDFLISIICAIIISIIIAPILDNKFEAWLNKIPNRLLGLSAFVAAICVAGSFYKKITKNDGK